MYCFPHVENQTVGRSENMQGQVVIHVLLTVKVFAFIAAKIYRTFHDTDGATALMLEPAVFVF